MSEFRPTGDRSTSKRRSSRFLPNLGPSWRLTISENGAEGAVISAMLEPYLSDPRVNLVSTGSEVSAPQNATRAIQAGRARYVALLHDDDRWDRGFLSRRVSFLEPHKTWGLVFSHCNYIGETGDLVYRYTANLREGLQPRRTFLCTLYRQNVIAVRQCSRDGRRTTPWDQPSVNLSCSTIGKCGYELRLTLTSASWTCTTLTTVFTLRRARTMA